MMPVVCREDVSSYRNAWTGRVHKLTGIVGTETGQIFAFLFAVALAGIAGGGRGRGDAVGGRLRIGCAVGALRTRA